MLQLFGMPIGNRKRGMSTQLWLVLTDRPFGNALTVSFSGPFDFHCSIEKRRGKVGRYVSYNESSNANSKDLLHKSVLLFFKYSFPLHFLLSTIS